MAGNIRRYSIRPGRFRRGCLSGFSLEGDGTLRAVPTEQRRHAFLGAIDGGEKDCPWGRLAFSAQLPSEMALTVMAFATNERYFLNDGAPMAFDALLLDEMITPETKRSLFEAAGATRADGANDLLLFGQNGRYLYVCLSLEGQGEAALSRFAAFAPGENFLQTFPEVYNTDDDFFRRYLAIFSAMYNDLQDRIDGIHSLVDANTAPPALLLTFARWLGIDLSADFLEEDQLRRLVKQAHRLIQKKGTRQAIEGVVRVLLEDEVFYIVESGALRTAASPYNFAVLLNRAPDERLQARLTYLIGQFKPARSRVKVVFIGRQATFGSCVVMDVNARIQEPEPTGLDEGDWLNGTWFMA